MLYPYLLEKESPIESSSAWVSCKKCIIQNDQ